MRKERFDKFCVVCGKMTDAKSWQNFLTFQWDETYKSASGRKFACCSFCSIWRKDELRKFLENS